MLDVSSVVFQKDPRCPARADPHGRGAVRLLDVPKNDARPATAAEILTHHKQPRTVVLAQGELALVLVLVVIASSQDLPALHLRSRLPRPAPSALILSCGSPARPTFLRTCGPTPARSCVVVQSAPRERRRLTFPAMHTHNPNWYRARGSGRALKWDIKHALQSSPRVL